MTETQDEIAFSDVDGVLDDYRSSDSKEAFPKPAIEAIERLHDAGIDVVYISGKTVDCIKGRVEESGLPINKSYFIGESGAVVKTPDETYVNPNKRDLETFRRIMNTRMNGFGNYILEEDPKIATTAFITKTDIDKNEFEKYINSIIKENDLGLHCLSSELSNGNYCFDITPGVDKSVGPIYLARGKKSYGIGDSTTDIPFLALVDYPAAPYNASSDVKDVVRQRGGYIADQPAADGTLKIIKSFWGF